MRYRSAVILVLAFCVTVLIYMLVARFITPGQPIPGSEKWSHSIYSGVITLGIMVVALRRLMMSRWVMGWASSRGVNTVLGNLTTMTIICATAAEVAAILGLLFYILTGDFQYSWRLGVVSLLLMVYSFPRRGEWERAVIASAKAQSDHPATV